MRKWKFAILFVLVLCLTVGMLVACDQTGGNSGTYHSHKSGRFADGRLLHYDVGV